MKTSIFLVVVSTLLGHAIAHYTFGRLIYNNKWTDTWEYVRQISPYQGRENDELYLLYPIEDPSLNDLRCGRNASTAWSRPKTAVVNAGDTVGIAAGVPALGKNDPNMAKMYHQGYASAWLSKAPGDLNAYTGDGDWFKILSVTARTEQSPPTTGPAFWAQWGAFEAKSWNFTIPATTPPGNYLLRWEHIYPLSADPKPLKRPSQFYVNCAHISVVNPTANVGKPGPLVKIPGVYTFGQKDIYFDSDNAKDFDIKTWVPPKPEVWSG